MSEERTPYWQGPYWQKWEGLKEHGNTKTGYLHYLEGIPFEVRRVFWITEWPHGIQRGGHAHRRCHQLFIPLSGWLTFTLHTPYNGDRRVLNPDEVDLSAANSALYVKPMVWLEMTTAENSDPCSLLCLCSEPYEESEYIRSYDEWQSLILSGP